MEWEYKIWPQDDLCVTRGYEPPKRIGEGHTQLGLPRLRKYGKEGWELTAVYDGVAYFKRPKPVEIPVELTAGPVRRGVGLGEILHSEEKKEATDEQGD